MMVNKIMFMKIMELKRHGKSRRGISRELGLDRKTVNKYFNMSDNDFRNIQAESMYREKAFDTYTEMILEVYRRNNYRKINVSAVYDYLEEKYGSLPGNEKTLRNFVQYLVQTGKLEFSEKPREYTKVAELPRGKQLQLDFGQYRLNSGLKMYIFATILSSSRYRYAVLQDRPFTTRDVIDHLLSCFDHIDGLPEELVIDQDRLMVVSENHGDIIYTKDFDFFIKEMDLKMYVCRKADPESKGKVENTVKYIKYNFLSIRDFKDIEEANEGMNNWLERRANGKICQATGQLPSELILEEREYLHPLRNSIFRKESLAGREIRLVNEKCQISVQASQYGVPAKYRNRKVEIYTTLDKLFIYDEYDGKEIAEYDLSPIPGKTISKREFSRLTEHSAKELKEEVKLLFSGENWERFLLLNFKAFPRYVRDQCIEALKYFKGKKILPDIFSLSIDYCVENNTLSFSSLNDTYRHFLHANENRQKYQAPSSPENRLFNKSIGTRESITVARRPLSFYEIAARGEEAAQ